MESGCDSFGGNADVREWFAWLYSHPSRNLQNELHQFNTCHVPVRFAC